MPSTLLKPRGLLIAALVFLLGACSAPPPEAPATTRSLISAVEALRLGDLARLRDEQGKGHGAAKNGSWHAVHLDPEAWLIVLGASTREYDFAAAANAMRDDNDAAFAAALGFDDQQLLADILGGGGSIYSRRADGRNWYEVGPQPVDLLNGFSHSELPQGCIALETTLIGTLEERRFNVSFGIDTVGVTNLTARLELAQEPAAIPDRAARYLDPLMALPSTGKLRQLALVSLQDERWESASFTLLHADGTIERAKLARNDDGWVLVESSAEPLIERLAAQRDERLEFLRLRALGFERTSGRWPRGLHEISFKPSQLTDPAAPDGRRGWADHDQKPPAGLELATSADAEYAVIATHVTAQGRRAVSRDGRFIWLK